LLLSVRAATEATVGDSTDVGAIAAVRAATEATVGDSIDVGAIAVVRAATEATVGDQIDVGVVAAVREKFRNAEIESYLPIRCEEHLIELEYELIDNLEYLVSSEDRFVQLNESPIIVT